MDTHPYYDRKHYVEQVRSSFSGESERKGRSYVHETEAEDREVRGFFKVRLVLAVVLFLAFLFVQQADISYKDINASSLAEQIQSTISLPESLPELDEFIHIQE